MTDIEFYTALQICMTADPKHKQCGKCPLLHSERACEYEIRDEIRHRLIKARQDNRNGFAQLNFISSVNEVMPMGDSNGRYCGQCGRKFTDGVGNYCQACGTKVDRRYFQTDNKGAAGNVEVR